MTYTHSIHQIHFLHDAVSISYDTGAVILFYKHIGLTELRSVPYLWI